MISFKDHKLLLALGNVSGVGLQDVRENHFNRDTDLGPRCQRRWQLHSEKLPTAKKERQ